MDNELRRDLAASALAHYRSESPNYRSGPGLDEPDEQAIEDLIADLLHLAKRQGADPDAIAQMALIHIESEI
jgi:hypothetical protein